MGHSPLRCSKNSRLHYATCRRIGFGPSPRRAGRRPRSQRASGIHLARSRGQVTPGPDRIDRLAERRAIGRRSPHHRDTHQNSAKCPVSPFSGVVRPAAAPRRNATLRLLSRSGIRDAAREPLDSDTHDNPRPARATRNRSRQKDRGGSGGSSSGSVSRLGLSGSPSSRTARSALPIRQFGRVRDPISPRLGTRHIPILARQIL